MNRFRLIVGVVCAALSMGCTTTTSKFPNVQAAPLVSTTGGMLRGVTQAQLGVFRGIPYAAPPVGELRWAAPQPLPGWEGVRDASAFGAACIQPVSYTHLTLPTIYSV